MLAACPEGTLSTHVSAAISELEKIGVIRREREGLNRRYFVNPLVATNLARDQRKKAQAEAAPLVFVTLRQHDKARPNRVYAARVREAAVA